MPVFRMVCDSCGIEKKKLLRKPEWYLCDVCTTGKMEPQLPKTVNSVTKEMKDPRRGVSHPKGLDKQLKSRMTKHADSHELAEQIDCFGTDDAKKLGWDKRVKRT